jgi:hypothetical protein
VTTCQRGPQVERERLQIKSRRRIQSWVLVERFELHTIEKRTRVRNSEPCIYGEEYNVLKSSNDLIPLQGVDI